MPHSQVRHGSGGITDDHQGIETTGTAHANKRVPRDLLGDIDALRAARERATLETAPMRGMPADDWQRATLETNGCPARRSIK